MPINMTEIARLARVSIATVSRAFNHPERVSPAVRDRILKIAADNNYVYHAAAADLSRRRSNTIGVLFPGPVGSLYAETLMGIQEQVQEWGASLVVGHTDYNPAMEAKLIRQFQERRVAGIIFVVYSSTRREMFASLNERGIRCVVTWELVEDPVIDHIGFDNLEAARRMTGHLIDLGHRRIGLLVGPYDKLDRATHRFQGYRTALADHGLEFDPSLVEIGLPDLNEGYRAMERLLKNDRLPTAVFAASDHLAIGALSAIKEAGLRVPEDISLTGFDGLEYSAYCDPPLTTFRLPIREMGRLAARAVYEHLNNPDMAPVKRCLDVELIVRRSTAPPQPGI